MYALIPWSLDYTVYRYVWGFPRGLREQGTFCNGNRGTKPKEFREQRSILEWSEREWSKTYQVNTNRPPAPGRLYFSEYNCSINECKKASNVSDGARDVFKIVPLFKCQRPLPEMNSCQIVNTLYMYVVNYINFWYRQLNKYWLNKYGMNFLYPVWTLFHACLYTEHNISYES